MFKAFISKIKESLLSVFPVAVIVLAVALTPLVDFSVYEIIAFLISSVALIAGISLFNLGADLAMTPMGEHMGSGLAKTGRFKVLVSVCFVMGVLITVAEPDLSVLAEQVAAVLDGTVLIVCVGVGVGIFLLIAVLRIAFRKDLSALLMFFYMALFSLCALMLENGKAGFLPLAFDSGGVTTGPITVPFIMALGVGISATIGGKNSAENSFGLVALCSVGPILAVMALSLASSGDIDYALPVFSVETNVSGFFSILGSTVLEVVKAVGLIVLCFLVLQFTVLKLPKQKLIQIVTGVGYTFVGLVVFLTAVTVGFMPIGFRMGEEIAARGEAFLIIFAFVIGAVTVLAEPAVHVLNRQVEEITDGGVSKRSMLIALSVGVGISIALSVIRIIFRFSLLWYLIPGYFVSLGLSLFVPKMYTAIAFDSGGVASGPLTSSFILPMAIGICYALNGVSEVMNLAFGAVAMVALTPLITIQFLGFRSIASAKIRERIVMKRILDADDGQIIYFS